MIKLRQSTRLRTELDESVLGSWNKIAWIKSIEFFR
jgi:hypothetical protein